MKNKLKSICRAVALLLCAAFLCVPLMGMSAATGGSIHDNGGCILYCECTVRCTEDARNPDCPTCPRDISVCVGKIMPCVCTVKCTAEAHNADCVRCGFAIYGCDGKAPEPAPVCSCDAKTRPVFDAYKAARYSKKYLAEHEAELATYRAARTAMNDILGGAKLPKMDALKKSRQELTEKKKALYTAYRAAQQEMREAVAVKGNIDHLLGLTDEREKKEQTR